MNISLLELELNIHAQSWLSILSVNNFHLFYIEWDYERNIKLLFLFGIRIILKV